MDIAASRKAVVHYLSKMPGLPLKRDDRLAALNGCMEETTDHLKAFHAKEKLDLSWDRREYRWDAEARTWIEIIRSHVRPKADDEIAPRDRNTQGNDKFTPVERDMIGRSTGTLAEVALRFATTKETVRTCRARLREQGR